MKMYRLIFYLLSFSTIHTVQFQTPTTPYLFSHEYDQLFKQGNFDFKNCSAQNRWRLQQMQHNFLWHLKIPTLQNLSGSFDQKNQKSSKLVRVAVLDTNFDSKFFNLKENNQSAQKSSSLQENYFAIENIEGIEKNSLNQKLEIDFFPKFFKKNHGACTCVCIQQIVPDVEIILIPILNDHGFADKKSLCDGLRSALTLNVDIVHLGLSVDGFDDNQEVDHQIKILLQQCRYVVVAAGNQAAQGCQISDFVANIFFSVGAFEKVDNYYKICDFSQFQPGVGPNFVMPGHDIVMPIFHEQLDDLVYVQTAGTSMAAAMMTGCLAQLLSLQDCCVLTIQQMQYLVQKNSVFLDADQWKNKVVFGTINQQANIFCLKVIHKLQEKMSDKKINKNFEKIINFIVEYCDQNNYFVKNKSNYALRSFSKKIDRKLRLLVELSINQVKEHA